MIKFVSEPDGVVVLVEIYQNVAGYDSAGNISLRSGNKNGMTIGKNGEIMVRANDCGQKAKRPCT